MLLLLTLACQAPTDDTAPVDDTADETAPADDTGADGSADSEDGLDSDDPPDTGDSGGGPAAWNVLVFMNGDNNLEALTMKDLNELEQAGSGDGVNVLVQVDRAEGYYTGGGDWTGARRYRVVADEDTDRVSSELLEDLGEVDMGAPETLADFLLWAGEHYPAEHTFLSLWDHGDGWYATATEPPPPSISADEESGNTLYIAEGDLSAGLQPWVEGHGPLDIVAFDACNMAQWEVAHSLRGQAVTMVASEAWVNTEGLMYAPFIGRLRADPSMDARTAAASMPADSVWEGEEFSFSAIDVEALDGLSAAIDAIAAAGLDGGPEARARLLAARDGSRGADNGFPTWYLDLKDFGAQVDAQAAAAPGDGAALVAALEDAVLASEAQRVYDYVGGLSFFYEFDNIEVVTYYSEGAGATWSRDTRWDDLLRAHHADEAANTAR